VPSQKRAFSFPETTTRPLREVHQSTTTFGPAESVNRFKKELKAALTKLIADHQTRQDFDNIRTRQPLGRGKRIQVRRRDDRGKVRRGDTASVYCEGRPPLGPKDSFPLGSIASAATVRFQDDLSGPGGNRALSEALKDSPSPPFSPPPSLLLSQWVGSQVSMGNKNRKKSLT
jgi:hypothetical protein